MKELISACKEKGINCAVETSMLYYDEEIFKNLDFVMADFKICEEELHKKYTGVGNSQIKQNFIKLNALGIPIIARTPIIPEIEQGIDKISKFLSGLENVKKYELLPYHPLGTEKNKALGIENKNFSIPDKKYMKELERYVFVRPKT